MWNNLTWVSIGALAALGCIVTVVAVRRSRGSKKQMNGQRNSNVVEFRPRKPVRQSRVGNAFRFKVSATSSTTTEPTGMQNTGKQKCSFCKKEDKLTFYADNNGSLYGVCKKCKYKAERQDMLPL
ncbi:hypothetical protein ACFQ5D_13910 [Paenibacillus farraposensis]|uniref:Uncharacterized protein n=1 Tax=Paenibacillus farraposensis TaxID=2807095 RepID=A0ABW4DF65_9BACL|nr:hypothetical protein [Paenibacillus farraposensis]MCC3379208.1 hypothetical protein [Paenibacillus farraposensis]